MELNLTQHPLNRSFVVVVVIGLNSYQFALDDEETLTTHNVDKRFMNEPRSFDEAKQHTVMYEEMCSDYRILTRPIQSRPSEKSNKHSSANWLGWSFLSNSRNILIAKFI